ncbi:MAG: MarR family winged helix-turn-helix transcriptional regulator [Novosphingobium sp.]
MNSTPASLADFLPYLLSITSNAVSDRIADEYRAHFGLKIPEWRVMAVLGDKGTATQRALVEATRMDKVAVNRACRGLEERGLLTRRPNNADGRSHHLGLTPAGQKVHGAIMPMALEMEGRLFSALSIAERDLFKDFLQRLRAQAEMTTGTKS